MQGIKENSIDAFLEGLERESDRRLNILLYLPTRDSSVVAFLTALRDRQTLGVVYLVDTQSSEGKCQCRLFYASALCICSPVPVQILDLDGVVQRVSLIAAAGRMQNGEVDILILEPDQIAGNGDASADVTALALAILAKDAHLPLYLITNTSIMRSDVASGREIREGITADKAVISPDLIRGIVTEQGVLYRQGTAFDVTSFGPSGKDSSLSNFSKFVPLTEQTAIEYVQANPSCAKQVGPPGVQLKCREATDGNINYIYIVEGPAGGLVIKQGRSYIRIVGESWPLTQVSYRRHIRRTSAKCVSVQDRLRIEGNWMKEQNEICPQYIPDLYLLDETMSLIVMEYLAPPFQTLRSGILAGKIYPMMSSQVAEFLARSLFFTSALALKSDVYRVKVKEFHNPELCQATEQVIFMDAYYEAPTNAYLKPELEHIAADLRDDAEAKIAIGRLRNAFLSKMQALIHSDLHSGSVMVKEDAMVVFDGEFAFYGPMGFDVGKFIGNLLLTFYALDGHATSDLPREKQQAWILDSVIQVCCAC